MDTSAIFQRTDIGRDTIKTKAVKLTQSERLLLIIIDGATPYGILRKEVWALSEDRFDRALRTLLKENLIFEVLMPIENQEPELLDTDIVDLFLQQDPLDPVTIISFDPEDEFGLEDYPKAAVNSPAPVAVVEAPVVPELDLELTPSQAPSAVVNASPAGTIPELGSSVPLQPLTELMVEEDLTPPSLFQTPASPHVAPNPLQAAEPMGEFPENWPENLSPQPVPRNNERVHWAYWVALVSGVAMLGVSLFANLH